jgi:hypothetical protein
MGRGIKRQLEKYPRTASIRPLNGRGARCSVCGELASYRVEIQVSIFRGDDEVENRCEAHKGKKEP